MSQPSATSFFKCFLALLLAACGGGSGSSGTTDPTPGGGGTSGGGGGGAPAATYRVTLNPASGVETNLRAVVWVGPRAVTRAEAADGAALRSAGFVNNTFETDASGGTLSRAVSIQRGQTATIIAIESEGIYNTTQFDAPPAPQNGVVEWVSFGGTGGVQNDAGVASFVAGASNVDVIVNYRRMPQIVVSLIGAGRLLYEFTLPAVLDIPQRPNPLNRSFAGNSVILAPTRRVYVTMQMHSGSPITMTAQPSGEFVGWDGACSGGLTCALRFGGGGGAQDQTTVLRLGYLMCTTGGSTTYSGYTAGQAVPANCTIVRP